jgi:plastocyanin
MIMKKSIPAIVLVAALLGAACAKSTTGAQAGSPTPSPSNSSSGGYGRYGGGGSPSPAPSVAADTLQQGAGNAFVFTPTTITVAKGSSLTIANVGSAAHSFTVPNTSIDVVNAVGQTQSTTINLKAGTYQFICRFHVSFGMKGTLIVTG